MQQYCADHFWQEGTKTPRSPRSPHNEGPALYSQNQRSGQELIILRTNHTSLLQEGQQKRPQSQPDASFCEYEGEVELQTCAPRIELTSW